ncbi:MAG: ATP phosphoribosyltransferase regulatory subunit [Amaricoccus sp.]
MIADRAYLSGARIGGGLQRLEAEVARILTALGATGAMRVEPAALQPADVLLDLYGEDVRARAFVTGDDGAEMMLRPDFTVPIVRLHMDAGAETARYVYCGPVWRRQDAGSDRPREFLQAGFEVFEAGDPAAGDAEVLALILDALGGAPVEVVTGDLGLVLAAIDALETSASRKAALRRHVWRPARFHALLHRFGDGHAAAQASRAELLAAQARGDVPALVAAAGAAVGLRAAEEVEARAAHLAAEAATPPLAPDQVEGLEAVLAVEGSATEALDALAALARRFAGLDAAVGRHAARLDALAGHGVAADGLRFEGSFGRTTLEYYDGFVFGALPRGRADLPPIASGGRYDALTRVLGRGRSIPAVGGIVRPEALLALGGGAWA